MNEYCGKQSEATFLAREIREDYNFFLKKFSNKKDLKDRKIKVIFDKTIYNSRTMILRMIDGSLLLLSSERTEAMTSKEASDFIDHFTKESKEFKEYLENISKMSIAEKLLYIYKNDESTIKQINFVNFFGLTREIELYYCLCGTHLFIYNDRSAIHVDENDGDNIVITAERG